MPYNGAGVYTLPAGSLVADGTTIDAADHNTPIQDIEAALSTVVLRNGAAPMTGNQVISVNSEGSALRITQTGAGNALLVEDSSNPDSSPTVIDSNGNVGIGVMAPSERLHVADGNGIIESNSTNNAPFLNLRNTNPSATGVFGPGVVFRSGVAGAKEFIITQMKSAGAPLRISDANTPFTPYVSFEQNGNVGIGAATVLDRLHVADGNMRLDGRVGDNFNGLIVRTPGASASEFRGGYVNTHNENDWAVAGIEFDVLQNGAGNLNVNTTPPGARTSDRRRRTVAVDCGATSGRLSVAGAGGFANTEGRIDILADADGPTRNSFISVRHRSSSASGDWYQSFWYNNSVIGSITQFGITGVSYNTSSDYRLKENFTPLTGGLARTLALQSGTFTWKSDGSGGEGFLAHQLQAVIPDAVTGEKDAVDADGNPVYQAVDLSRVVPTLVAAIQEQQAMIAALTARVETLEAAQT